jgi:phosphoadenosine phosphosulfate reductase
LNAPDLTLFGDQIAASRLADKFAALDAQALLRLAIEDLFPGKIALVSSFGADSAVLLHMIAKIDAQTPVVFIDTGQLFPETLAYRDRLVDHLGLASVQSAEPDGAELAEADPDGFLWATDPDRCCAIRKVNPLTEALAPFEAWITGRKRYQGAPRATLALFEAEGDRIKVNPLARWNATMLIAYLDRHELPRHPLVAKGYPSIGCGPCTSEVGPGEDSRAGRWRGRGKTECGIHLSTLNAGGDI